MRYFFDFENDLPIMDKRGKECRTKQDAEAFAKQIARELGHSKSAGEFIVVKDESGMEVFRTPVTDQD